MYDIACFIIVYIVLSLFRPDVQASKYETALHVAARGGQTACMAALLMHGAEPSLQNVDGDMPLHCAARAGGWQQAHLLQARQSHSTTCSITQNGATFGFEMCFALSILDTSRIRMLRHFELYYM